MNMTSLSSKTSEEFANNRVTTERLRMLAELRRREQQTGRDVEEHWHPAERIARAEARRTAVAMLHQAGALPTAGDPCLEVGYGTRGWLGALIDWGVRETDLHGIELDPISAKKAQEILPLADLRIGDATELPWESHMFRLVIASTVFTSILEPAVRSLIAEEIT